MSHEGNLLLPVLFINQEFGGIAEAYSEPCQTCKIELFAKIVYTLQLLTSFTKSSECTTIFH